ncbi:hypothetical protein CspeluHIS016_0602990 [Cutaneotrichosporon spelunceum]|uniref:Integrase catalytic domain-containing protein n=1 Tax=Cutaneotrichosporon spelunceum TaxID=1672016 RepID=A0AAD3TYQ6_9TREE|nr:hypothetical protein CspeluHIS016_0602990 [Cutaneotrichosporon spelunceum]
MDDASSGKGSAQLSAVPTLSGMANWASFEHHFLNYLASINATALVRGTEVEPFRKYGVAAARPTGELAGNAPPHGVDAIDPDRLIDNDGFAPFSTPEVPQRAQPPRARVDMLTREEIDEWRRWARRETAARSAIALKVPKALYWPYRELWSCKDVFDALKAKYRVDTSERRNFIMAKLNATFLGKDATVHEAGKHLNNFLALTNEYAENADAPLSDDMVCTIFLMSLSGQLGTLIRSIVAPHGNDWAELQHAYNRYIDTEKMMLERDKGLGKKTKKDKAGNIAAIAPDGDKGPHGPGGKKSNKKGYKGKNGNDADNGGTVFCGYCGYRNHTDDVCRRKASGLPSAKEILAFKMGTHNKPNSSPNNNSGKGDGGNTASITTLDPLKDFYSIAAISAVTDAPPSMTSSVLVNGGASHHIFGNPTLLDDIEKLDQPQRFRLAGTVHFLTCASRGNLVLSADGDERVVMDVLISEETVENILSKPMLMRDGWSIDGNDCFLTNGGFSIPLGTDGSGRPQFKVNSANGIISAIDGEANITELHTIHKRFGHRGRKSLLSAIRDGLIDGLTAEDTTRLENDTFKLTDCTACLEGRALRHGAPGASPRGRPDGEILHFDIKGPLIASVSGLRYQLTCVADYLNIRIGFPINEKDAATVLARIKYFHNLIKLKITVTGWRTDGGNEFVNTETKAFTSANGILHQVAAPYIHQHNGVAEAANLFLSTLVHVNMLAAPALPTNFWEFALRHANNISLMTNKSIDGKSGWEVLSGRHANYSAMRQFGEVGYATLHVPQDRAKSLPNARRGTRVRILYRDINSSHWIVYVEHNGAIGAARDITFTDAFSPAEPLKRVTGPAPPISRSDLSNTPAVRGPGASVGPSTVPSRSSGPSAASIEEIEESEYHHLASLEAAAAESAHATLEHPATIGEALAGPDGAQFAEAMQVELDALEAKGTWSEASLPQGRKALSTKWVPTRKYDGNGNVKRHKARLVGRGFSQLPGVDFNETYSPVARAASLRVLCAIAAHSSLHLHQADVEAAYLNAPLEEEIYIAFPQGYTPKDKTRNCLRLHRALYGLKQSGRAWWLELSRALEKLGYKRLHADWGLYIRTTKDGSRIILFIYVDDILVICDHISTAKSILEELGRLWTITDLGPAHQILGMVLERDMEARTVTISQTAYIEKILVRHNIINPRAGRTSPLPTGEQPMVADAAIDQRHFQEIVGSILWLAGTSRPDVAFAASLLGRHSHAPGEEIWAIAKRVLAYLYHTRDKKLVLGNVTNDSSSLVAYSDSDWAACPTGRSTSGWVVFYKRSAVNWSSKRQGATAASTMEAEYYAAAGATHEIIWMRSLLAELGEELGNGPTTLNIDNQAAIRLASNPHSHSRAKHINVKYHITRDEVKKGTIAVSYINTVDQPADVLTKALSGPRHSHIINLLGLH